MLGLYSVDDYPSFVSDPGRGTVTGTNVAIVVLSAGVLDCSNIFTYFGLTSNVKPAKVFNRKKVFIFSVIVICRMDLLAILREGLSAGGIFIHFIEFSDASITVI